MKQKEQRIMGFQKSLRAVLVCVGVVFCGLEQAAHGGVEDVFSELGINFEKTTLGSSQIPIYRVQPFAELQGNRNHWDDMVVKGSSPGESVSWRGVVSHYTVCNFKDTLDLFTKDISDGRVSAHFVIAQEEKDLGIKGGEIIQLVPLENRAWHAGVSGWQDVNGAGIKGMNACFLGIEHVNPGFVVNEGVRQYFSYDERQIEASVTLQKELQTLYPSMSPSCFVGHDDITERKQDPGPLFPWKKFFESEVGAFLTPEELEAAQVSPAIPQGTSLEFLLTHMRGYGYNLDPQAGETPKNIALIEAFRGHFSCNMAPETVPLGSNPITRNDMAWIWGLTQKYSPTFQ